MIMENGQVITEQQMFATLVKLHGRLATAERRLTEIERAAEGTFEGREIVILDVLYAKPYPRKTLLPTADRLALAQRTLDAIAAVSGITIEAIMGPGRTREVALARQVAMYLLVTDCGLTSVQTGKALHRDHSSVLYGIKRVEAFLEADGPLRSDIKAIRQLLQP